MLFINIYRFILGFVEIIVSGEFPEKILNLLAVKNISVWDIKRGKNEISLKIYIRDFKKFRKIRGKSRLHIRIIKKNGLIFLIRRYFKRIGIPVGALIFFITLYFFSLFVWNIAVVGNTKVSTLEIENYCRELGVKNGALISNINSQLLREKLLLKCGGLSWCSFNIEGSKITVNVSEISENKGLEEPSNIVSDYDCIITDIYVESGVANVNKGQTVSKGDLLVSGISDIDSVNRFVKSKANITAEINETIKVSGDFSGEKSEFNGLMKRKNVLEFFGIKIPLYLGEVIGKYSSDLTVKNLYFFGEKIPIRIFNKNFYMQTSSVYNFSREELLINLTKEIEDKISQIAIDYEVISRDITENENTMTVIYDVKFKKNIGVEKKLIFNVSN